MKRFIGIRFFSERLSFINKSFFDLPVDNKFAVREFHFADIYDPVFSVDQKIDLYTRNSLPAPPGKDIGLYPAYAENLLDLRDMVKTQDLKCIPSPGIIPRRTDIVLPGRNIRVLWAFQTE